jgi:hypothetical protein
VIFHLSIYTKVTVPKQEEKNVSGNREGTASTGNEEQARRPLTKEEIYLSKEFVKYEKSAFKLYIEKMREMGL